MFYRKKLLYLYDINFKNNNYKNIIHQICQKIHSHFRTVFNDKLTEVYEEWFLKPFKDYVTNVDYDADIGWTLFGNKNVYESDKIGFTSCIHSLSKKSKIPEDHPLSKTKMEVKPETEKLFFLFRIHFSTQPRFVWDEANRK